MERFQRQQIDVSRLPRQVVSKWASDVLVEGFVPFPKMLVRSLGQIFGRSATTDEISALLAVVDYTRPNLTRLPSRSYLAHLAGLSEEDFRAALNRLEERGLVTVEGDDENLGISLGGLLNEIREACQ